MIIKTTDQVLKTALNNVNKKYSDNITMTAEAINNKQTRFHVRLSVVDSKAAGARRSATGRRIKAACWHVHGHFFDHILDIDSNATIKAGALKISKDGGNWQDRNIGSIIHPFRFSDACECNH